MATICPYCAENVNLGASVCKTCGREVALVLSLQQANHTLEERVAELEAELRELRPAEATVPIVEEPPRPPGIFDLIAIYLVLPTIVLVGAHYLLVIRFDAKLIWLRAASIAVPMVFGLMLDRRLHPRWFITLAYGVAVALVAVFGMSTMVHFIDGDAILPDSVVAWRETLEYITSIALSYLLGSLLARVARPIKLTRTGRTSRTRKLATLIATHVSGRKGEPLEMRIQRTVKLIQIGISASTAIGAIYTGFKGIL